jgi:hypothetical protein
MCISVSISLSEEVGPPACGLVEVSCTLEFDDESRWLQDREVLQRAVAHMVVTCCQAVDDPSMSCSSMPDAGIDPVARANGTANKRRF